MSPRVSARLVLILGGLSLLLWMAGVLLLVYQGATGTTPYGYWREGMLITLVSAAVGAIVATRRPANPIGWLLLALGLIGALQFLSGEYAATTLALSPQSVPYGPTGAWLSILMQTITFFPLLFLLLLFPTGRLLSSRWRVVAWMAVCGVSLSTVKRALNPTIGGFDNPFGIHAAILDPIGAVAILLTQGALLAALLSLVLRLIRSRGEERQQIKWFVAAAVLGALALLVNSLLLPANAGGELGNWLWPIVGASLPVAIGIAVLRYRLYDIDLIINRALVYGSLTVLLAATYEGGVVLLQDASRALTGEQSGLVIVASTLAIAALFTPLRRCIQSFIDRRFYRSKYDARKTLEAFSAKLRDETDLEALNEDLVGVVKETIQPAHVSLWLRPESAPRGVGAD